MNINIIKKLFPKAAKRIEKHRCPLCNKKIDLHEFKDSLSLKEYQISGMCQACQDKAFDINNADHPSRQKAIKVLEQIAEYMGDDEMFDCKVGSTTWYDLEDIVTAIINKTD